MMDFIKGAVSVLLLIGLLCLGIWFAAVDNTNKKWELRLARAHHKIDSLLKVEHIPVPPESVLIRAAETPSPPDYQAKVDSAFSAGKSAGADSLKALVDYLAQPWTPRVAFPSGDTVLCEYKPLTHTGSVTLLRPPIEVRTLLIHDSTLVTLPLIDARNWWDIPLASASGLVAGIVIGFLATH